MSDYKDYGYSNDRPIHTFGYLSDPLLSLLNENTNRYILDIGCGNGHITNYLITKGFNVYGTDASATGISIANRINPGKFFIQDLTSDQLPEELRSVPFDTIISTEVIEHLYDPAGFIEFCKKVFDSKPGEIIISTPYHGYLKNLTLAIFNKWDTHFDPLWHGGHIKFWSRATLGRLLTNAGFTITDFRGCGRFPYFWKSMIIKGKIS